MMKLYNITRILECGDLVTVVINCKFLIYFYNKNDFYADTFVYMHLYFTTFEKLITINMKSPSEQHFPILDYQLYLCFYRQIWKYEISHHRLWAWIWIYIPLINHSTKKYELLSFTFISQIPMAWKSNQSLFGSRYDLRTSILHYTYRWNIKAKQKTVCFQ